MNEDVLNMSVRKFLKKVGVTSQREIEDAVRAALSNGKLKGNEALPAKVTLTSWNRQTLLLKREGPGALSGLGLRWGIIPPLLAWAG